MSHTLILATVTAVMKNLLENGLVDHAVTAALGSDATISALPPDQITTGPDEKAQLNLFLYQVHFKGLAPASRYARAEESSGLSLPRSLEIDYLLTAYGVDNLQTEILLGYGLALFQENQVLSAEAVQSILQALSAQQHGRLVPPAHASLADPSLLAQFHRIKICPQALRTEEMVNLWSAFQVGYRPSVAYHVSVELAKAAAEKAP